MFVDVLVREGEAAVKDLLLPDFELFDDGLPQRLLEVRQEQLPIDLTLLLDSSGSTADLINRFRTDAGSVMAMLRKEDRARTMAFATDTMELTKLESSGRVMFPAALPTGGTSLYDSLTLTLLRRTEPGRRHLIVGFTDGLDSTSVVTPTDLNRTARVSDAVLHLMSANSPARPTVVQADRLRLLREAAQATGGDLVALGGNAIQSLQDIFKSFRESYVLEFTPSGGRTEGWHQLSVRIKRLNSAAYSVRHRRGYYRGAKADLRHFVVMT